MPYSILIGALQIIPAALEAPREYTCWQAQKSCIPPFVFSITGQVQFRAALDHLTQCRARECASLRKKVKLGMQKKLKWLHEEDALLGCSGIQPFLYKARGPLNVTKQQNFRITAHHLANCPDEACARLRRALLLTVRDKVSPNKREEIAELSH